MGLSQAELSLVEALTRHKLVSPDQLGRTLELRQSLPHLPGALLASGALDPERLESALTRAGLALQSCASCGQDWLARTGDGCPRCGDAGLQRIGRYRVVRELARGGMGVVYEAIDEALHRPVALKLVRPGASADSLERFAREARLAARLSHPSIVPIHEVGSAGEAHYIAMELIDGRPLDEATASLDRRARVRLLRDVAAAVGHAHAHGVVHRDLKPANVLVRDDGRPVVTDFGLARDAESTTELTASGAVLGTVHYMAPEQVRGRTRDCTPAADVWALGVMLYELLAGQRPFTGRTAAELYQSITDDDPPPAPSDLDRVWRKALAKEPGRRHPDATELAAELDAWLDGRTARTRPARLLHALRRRRGMLVTLALLFAVLGLGVLLARERGRRTLPSVAKPAPRPAPPPVHAPRRADPLSRKIEETRAQFYIPGADLRGALLALEQALLEAERSGNPDSAQWQSIGVGWHLLGWADRARRALARATPDPRTRYYLGRIAFERARIALVGGPSYWTDRTRGQLDRALRLLGRAVAESGGHPLERQVALGYLALAREQPQEVLRICRAGLSRFSGQLGSEEFWLLQTWIGGYRERLAACRAGLARCPHHPWLVLMQGVIHQTRKDYARALASFTRAIEIAPRLSFAHASRGQSRWLQGDRRGALIDFDAALQLDPRDAPTWSNRGTVRFELGQRAPALADLDTALRIDPGLGVAYCNRSILHQEKGDLDRALADADRAVALAPHLGQAWNNRANIRKTRGDHAGAIADYDQAIRLDPHNADRYVNRASARSLKGDLPGAIADYTKGLQLNPRDAAAWYNRANLKLQTGDRRGALTDFNHAIEADPHYPDAWNNRASLKRATGDLPGALADYDQAVRLRPNDVDYRVNRAKTRAEHKDLPGALADLDAALRLRPDDPRARFNRGRVHFLSGALDKAEADFRAVLARQPKLAGAWLHLGLVLARAGKRQEALAALNSGRAVAGEKLRPEFDRLIARLKR